MKERGVLRFPNRIYTIEEFLRARKSIEAGHIHRLRVIGPAHFKDRIKEALTLIKKAKYYRFLRTYIRKICEIEGMSQLRETEAALWVNKHTINNPVECARFIIQKAYQMKAYLDGEKYYLAGELPAIDASIVFLKKLEEKLIDKLMKRECRDSIKRWTEDTVL
jgi:hypothetical protein